VGLLLSPTKLIFYIKFLKLLQSFVSVIFLPQSPVTFLRRHVGILKSFIFLVLCHEVVKENIICKGFIFVDCDQKWRQEADVSVIISYFLVKIGTS
jgi:hypothetical protein